MGRPVHFEFHAVCTANVDDVDASVARAVEFGGVVASPKMALPGMGWLAYVRDTESNVLDLTAMDPNAA